MASALLSLLLEGPAKLEDETDNANVWALVLMVTLLCCCIVIGHLLEDCNWINEATVAIILGLVTGGVLVLLRGKASTHILKFNEELFFIYLLPPIIFNAGFSVKKKQFFRNFFPIVLYGVVGVFISCSIITTGCILLFKKFGVTNLHISDYLALGTIFSSTDSVCVLQVLHQDETPLLYSLVFGEGVVNDATSVVLFRAIQKFDWQKFRAGGAAFILCDFLYLFTASTALGVLVGLASAYIIRTLYFGRHSTDREIALMALMAYLSYLVSEVSELSGILTVFFCGIVMSHYTWHNVTENSRITSRHAFAAISYIAETFIFLYVGLDALDGAKWERTPPKKGVGVFSTLFLLTLIGRAAFVFPLSWLANYARRGSAEPITFRHQVVIWWAGLMRGAVSVVLALKQFNPAGELRDPEHATVVASTMAVVLFTMLVFGGVTKPLVNLLLPQHLRHSSSFTNLSEAVTPTAQSRSDLSSPLLKDQVPAFSASQGMLIPPSSEPLGVRRGLTALVTASPGTVHTLWRRFDNKFMRPFFGGTGFTPLERGPSFISQRVANPLQGSQWQAADGNIGFWLGGH